MKINPHLNFNGQCEEAFHFYAKSLGGQIVALFKFAGSPAEKQVPSEWHEKVLHAAMNIDGNILTGADAPPAYQQKPEGFAVSIGVAEAAEGERIFHALSSGGTVRMPYAKTFWSPGFGMVVDRFGIPWMINTDQPAA